MNLQRHFERADIIANPIVILRSLLKYYTKKGQLKKNLRNLLSRLVIGAGKEEQLSLVPRIPKIKLADKFKVKLSWTKTYSARQTILRKGCEISDYFRQFPTLKGALGAELLSEDFKRHHPHAVETFFTRWNCARDIIKTALADCNKLKGVDSGYYSVLPALNQHNKDSVLFHLLPYLINSPRTKHRVGNITISKKEEAFLIRAETAANISGALERQRQICIATGSTLQPIPVIVGPIVNPEAFYVYVNDSLENPTIYQAESLLHAIA
ncbi:hypothetical protein PV325_010926 [Microctonus aethiopoides]|nr:hypothetical protein PV325_010926 [Microctonus aethiopoides]